MCHGGLDPKYQMRDIEARAKTWHAATDTMKQADRSPGLLAQVRGMIAGLWRKDPRHV